MRRLALVDADTGEVLWERRNKIYKSKYANGNASELWTVIAVAVVGGLLLAMIIE